MIKLPDLIIKIPTVEQCAFYSELNIRILSIWKNIPGSLHPLLLDQISTQAGYRFGESFDMFSRYPMPLWSTLYWITRPPHAVRVPTAEEMDLLLTANAMFMFLHGLDDHLNDGELEPDHLVLLVRSEGWHILRESLEVLSTMVRGAEEIINSLISDYYYGVLKEQKADSLEECLQRSKLQTATGVIVPALSEIICTGSDTRLQDIRAAIEQTGIAWRYADDALDVDEDIARSERTTVYHMLSDEGKRLWDEASAAKGEKRKGKMALLEDLFVSESVTMTVQQAIAKSFAGAEYHAARAGLDGLKNELSSLTDLFKL